MTLVELYLLPKGRITRRTFWLQGVLVFIFIGLVADQLDILLSAQGNVSDLAALLLIWPGLMLQIKRWHDRNLSGWWILMWLVPILGWIIASVEVGFLAGTPGPNRFGPPQPPTILESQQI
ncbi:MAG: DUF805 domain-containing protein [Chloroflexi bacterium]|nr:DUF805 domain-containing protein [Chloroflexota bacterium]